ncbi:hypothetical protein M405DRAFT_803184 [Rhizopogon salebrosus TDB-379]|nr:hypothetical protein M405DRAFT_803184 [Rhizopogon salebrosus TDB-379]
MLELIATGSNPLSRFYNDLALSSIAVAFVKPRAERHMQRQYKSAKTSTLSDGNMNVVGIVDMRTSSDNGLRRQSVAEARSNTARTLSSPSIDSTRLDTLPCPVLQPCTYPYYTGDCHALHTLAMSPSTTTASAITTTCLPHPRHKHTSPPLPHSPSCGHLPLSAGGEARVSMNILSRDEGEQWALA